MRIQTKAIVLAAALMMSLSAWADGPGVPFYRVIPATEYNGHNRNYDIACDDYGNVFVANFEALIYYDGATWRKLYTPGISRVTRLARGKDHRIWFGGYNVFGYLVADSYGCLKMKTIVSDKVANNLSEVDFIKVTSDRVYVHTTAKKTYYVVNDKSLKLLKSGGENIFKAAADSVNNYRNLPKAIQKQFDGSIQYVSHNQEHALWGATNQGLFMVHTPSVFSMLGENEGLKGEVNSITKHNGRYYIATMQGMFQVINGEAHAFPGLDLACWQFCSIDSQHMLVASSSGLLMCSQNQLRNITTIQTFSVCHDTKDGVYITGEVDGVYYVTPSGVRTKLLSLPNVTRVTYKDGKVQALSLYGMLWEISISNVGGKVKASNRCVSKNVDERTFLPSVKTQKWLFPFQYMSLNCVYESNDGVLGVGGEFGAYFIDMRTAEKEKQLPCLRPYIREVIAMEDSIMWGGFTNGTMAPRCNVEGIELPSNCENIVITYSTMATTLAYPTEYRYRINGGKWSQWSTETSLTLHSIAYRTSQIEVQSRDAFGLVSSVSTVTWYKIVPFYLTYWAFAIYFLLLMYLIYLTVRWRMNSLEAQKQKLERLVDERTADLKRTQKDLVRMERTATAGKLTQGLIDRILNPINYINNFSKLTSGLAKDLKGNIEDEKDNMSEDNYDDCQDIIDMMDTNLKKIEEHGVNTTRTLRAMEAILNCKVGTLTEHDLCELCTRAVDLTKEYHKTLIAENKINIVCNVPETPVMMNVDYEAMSKAIIPILTNGIYSLSKKVLTRGKDYKPEIALTLTGPDMSHEDESQESTGITISIRDNGVGIEQSIIDKVFDPFFTTKTTGEASGVGLYLVRNIINDHHGNITVASVKREYCEFTIKF